MNVFRRIISRFTLDKKGQQGGEVERYYFEYNRSRALRSCWVAHYLIYTKFLQFADTIPTLDLCCGCGAGTKQIAEALSVSTIGVDYSHEAIAYAKNHNMTSRTAYYILDLNEAEDLQALKNIIMSKGIRQCFCVEGIEHLKCPDAVLRLLLESQVQRLFISTPCEEEEAHENNKYHITHFTPSAYKAFSTRFDSRILSYCKFVDRDKLVSLLDSGCTEDDIRRMYFTETMDESSGNYLIEINRKKES